MLEAKPKKESVDREHDGDEDQPPEAKILPAAIARLFGGRQRRIAAAPGNAGSLFGGGRQRDQRKNDHHAHSEDPGGYNTVPGISDGGKSTEPETGRPEESRE